MAVRITISQNAYEHLSGMARARGCTVSELVDNSIRSSAKHHNMAQAAQNDHVTEFQGHPLPELPPRPQTPLDAQKAFIVAAAQNGWTTNEIILATNQKNWALTRAFINDTRRRAGYPARKTK